MKRSTGSSWLLGAGVVVAWAFGCVGGAAAAEAAGVGVVSNVKVLSDKVEDVSSLEAWKASNIKPGMTDEQKAVAIWKTVVKYRHQTAPPNEFLQQEANVHDVMKTIHVYGYGMCCCASADIECLGRYLGMGARGWAIFRHSVPELFYGGKWHLFDSSLMNYFRNPNGSIASVEEIAKAVTDWLADHKDLRHNGGKLRAFAKDEGWKKNGPALLATCEYFLKDGQNHAGWHGWFSTMEEYDGKFHPYEYGYSQGYRVNVQLRRGERLTRNWFNKGLHVNMDGKGDAPGEVFKPHWALAVQRKFGDIAPARVGNGTLEYDVPLADGGFRAGALAAGNLAAKADDNKAPAVHVKNASADGVLIVRMPSSYVYLGGELAFRAVVGSGGSLAVSFSDNNGLDWKPVASVSAGGPRKIDLKPLCYRRYDYRLKFVLKGAGTGLDALKITHDIQHSQAPLPALTAGENTITFSAGPQEGTVTVEAATDPGKKDRQLVVTDFHPVLDGVAAGQLRVKGYGPKGGSVTFPVETPGDITRVRFGGHYRARDKREGWLLEVSFDDGKTFKQVGKMDGPQVGSCVYVTADDVPAGTRKALVRYRSTPQRNTLCVFDFRIDADYKEPAGGFAPVKVTYVWEESGAEKRDVHVAKGPNETYKIPCAAKPVMKSLIVQRAD